MPANKTKKSSKARPNGWPKRFRIPALIIAVLVLGGIGYELYSQTQFQKTVEAERAQFEAAFNKLDEVKTIMTERNGKPSRLISNKNCSQPYLEVGEAPITCRVEFVLAYSPVNNLDVNKLSDDARGLYAGYFSIIKENLSPNLSGSEFTPNVDGDTQYKQFELVDKVSKLPCIATHSLKLDKSIDFSIALTCSKRTDIAIYQLTST